MPGGKTGVIILCYLPLETKGCELNYSVVPSCVFILKYKEKSRKKV